MTGYLMVAEVPAMHADQIERYGGSQGRQGSRAAGSRPLPGARLTADAQETYVFVAVLYATNQFRFEKLVPWLRSHVTQAPPAGAPR